MYHVKVFIKLTLFFVFLHETLSDCICKNSAQETNCLRSHLEENQVQNEQKLLPNTILPNAGHVLSIHCNLQKLLLHLLMNQKSLIQLDLSENLISTLPNDFFTSTPALEELYLQHNKLEHLTTDTFYALDNLKVLDISHNKISQIKLGVLDGMTKLEQLYLNKNEIVTLAQGIFDELHNLLVLDLSYNEISNIHSNLFISEKFKKLNLAGNHLHNDIFATGLESFNMIKSLNISNCGLTNLPINAFARLSKIQRLDLSKNEIKKLTESGIFSPMKNLTTLNLAQCALTDIPSDVFDENPMLNDLDLSCNRLQTLPTLFNSTQNLQFLNLSHNVINTLPVVLFQYTSLTEVDLSYNHLDTIEPDLLNMETLAKVHAQNNKITHLRDDTFATCNFPVQYLNLKNNRLVFLGEYFFDWLANLEQMEISGNPWDCTCLEELLKLLNDRFISYDLDKFHKGTTPICVSGNNICNYDNSNLTHYYEIYSKNFDVRRL